MQCSESPTLRHFNTTWYIAYRLDEHLPWYSVLLIKLIACAPRSLLPLTWAIRLAHGSSRPVVSQKKEKQNP